MTDQIWNEIGIQPPMDIWTGRGATIIVLNNTTDGAAFTKGEVVRLVAAGTDDTVLAVTSTLAFVDITAPAAPAATDAGSNAAMACYGVLLNDVADDGQAFVLVRGPVIADVDANGGAIDLDDALYVGGGADVRHLRNVEDLAAGEAVKVIARARNVTQLTTAGAKCAVLFNGIEGFGAIQGL